MATFDFQLKKIAKTKPEITNENVTSPKNVD